MNKYAWYTFILVMIFFSINLKAEQNKTLSQQLYEEFTKKKCNIASLEEVRQLNSDISCNQNPLLSQVKTDTKIENLEQVIDTVLFDSLAKNQISSLQCAQLKMFDYSSDAEIRNQLADTACEKFELLKELLKESENIKDWHKSFKTVNDSTARIVPKDDQIKYEKIIQTLEKRMQVIQSMIANIRQTTLLFESPEVFEYAMKELNSKKDSKKICENFKKELPSLLIETSDKIKKSLKAFNNYNLTTELKEQLWNNARSDEIITKLSQNELTKMSTICRMEGKYGKGVEIRDKLVQIGLFALPPILKLSESVAVATYAARTRFPFYVSKAILTTEVALSVSLNIHAIKRDCLDKNPVILTNGTNLCETKNAEERKNLILSNQSQSSCILAATLGAAGTFFSISSADKILKGLIPDSLMTKIGESNSKISELISQKGFYDAVEVISVQNEGLGKIVSVARKAKDADLIRPKNYKLSVPDPIFSPQTLVDNLGMAGKNLRITSSNSTFQVPDVTLYVDRISKYNAVAKPSKKIAITFYRAKDEIQESRYYNKKFIEEGSLPMAPSGTPGSTFMNTGHLHLHDITAHGAAVTIPKEIIDNARTGYKIVSEFEDYLKTTSPSLYDQAKKRSDLFKGNIFNKTHEGITELIDFSTAKWTHFVSNMRQGDIQSAYSSLWGNMDKFTGARTLGEVISNASSYLKVDVKIREAFENYLKVKKVDLNKPVFQGTEKLTSNEYMDFLFRKQQELTKEIANKTF